MKVNRLRLKVLSALNLWFTSFSKSHLSLALSLMIVFSCLTGFAASQLNYYTIIDNDISINIISASDKMNDVLASAGIKLGDEDFAEIVKGEDSNTITITRRCKLIVTADGSTSEHIVNDGTVASALKQAQITLGENDIVTPSLNTLMQETTEVSVDRVKYETVTKEEKVSYKKYLALAAENKSLDLGLLKENQSAVIISTFKNTIKNGEAVKTELISQTAKPVALTAAKKVTAKTTSIANKAASSYDSQNVISVLNPNITIELDKNGVPTSYTKLIKGTATAYCANQGALTSTGKTPKPGYIAVDPDLIPYGTKMFIRTTDGSYIYGYAIAADTGGFANSGDVITDLYFNTYQECINFGVRNVEIYILG